MRRRPRIHFQSHAVNTIFSVWITGVVFITVSSKISPEFTRAYVFVKDFISMTSNKENLHYAMFWKLALYRHLKRQKLAMDMPKTNTGGVMSRMLILMTK